MTWGLTKFKIEKVDENDFYIWKMKVEDLLLQNDQALASKGIAQKPSSMIY